MLLALALALALHHHVLLAEAELACPNPQMVALARWNEAAGASRAPSAAGADIPAWPPKASSSAAGEVESGTTWLACEDVSIPGGSVALSSEDGQVVWLGKTHEQYAEKADESYYLGFGKQAALNASTKGDALGAALLACNHSASPGVSCFSWQDAARALPPIRTSGPGGHWDNWEGCDGVRTFVGSRSSSADATFSDFGEDCSHNGFPSALGSLLPGYAHRHPWPWHRRRQRPHSDVIVTQRPFPNKRFAARNCNAFCSRASRWACPPLPRVHCLVYMKHRYSVINWTATNTGHAPIMNWTKYINFSAVADGLVGGVLPTMVLYFPVLPGNPYHELEGKRYWTMMASRARSVAGGIALLPVLIF